MSGCVILSACRTPGGKFGGSLSKLKAPELGAVAVKDAVERAKIETNNVGAVIMGNGWQAGVGPNPARIAALKSGLPETSWAFTVNMRCGSGLMSAMLLADKIRLGEVKAGVAGGMESASNVPYIAEGARWGLRMGEKSLPDLLHRDGFFCPLSEMMMGETAEVLAERYGISRQDQDAYALESHRRAVSALDNNEFDREIVPVRVKDRKVGEIVFDWDEIPMRNTSMEKLAKLSAIFKNPGTVTAGTSSALCDAASALVLADEDWAKANGFKPLARILGYAAAGLDPKVMGMGPAYSTPKALDSVSLSLQDMDLIELNEAFAVQVLACQKEMGFDLEKTNIIGGAISLGHPIGATGAKILTTLLYALSRKDKEFGLATACIGGGHGVSMVVQRIE